MRFLRTNTAIRVTVGPFIDKTDGVTPKTSLTVTNCHLTLMVDDANVPTLVLDTTPTASGGSNDMVHVTGDDAGFYDLELAAANVNYFGRAMLALTDAANHCPVFHEFMILPAVVYDAMVLGTDLFDVSTTQFNGTAVTAAAGRPEVNTTHAAGTAWASGSLTSGVFAAGAINASAIAADAITAAKVADGTIDAATFAAGAIDATAIATDAIGSAELASSAVTEIVNGVWNEVASGHTTSGSFGYKFGAHLPAILIGLTTAGSDTTHVVMNASTGIDGAVPSATNDFYNGAVLIFTSGTLAGQRTSVTAYVGSTQTLTITAVTGSVASGVSFILV